MKNSIRSSAIATAAALMLFGTASASAGELVQNGGFETATFANWTQNGNTQFTGVFNGAFAHTGT